VWLARVPGASSVFQMGFRPFLHVLELLISMLLVSLFVISKNVLQSRRVFAGTWLFELRIREDKDAFANPWGFCSL